MTAWSLERAEDHVLSLELFGMRFGLERMRRLLTVLGSPQRSFRAVHVVGTNGKSSTVRMTAALLEAHGVRTGSYLSPHLGSYAERVRVGDADVSGECFAAAVQRAAGAAEKVDRTAGTEDDRVTQFELLTAAAFDELARSEVQWAVVEAGLGGRHDATNVLGAPVVVLTNVGLEHTRWLGPTVTDIAREKLAVVGPDAELIVGELDPEAAREVAALGVAVIQARPHPGLPGYQRWNFGVACAAARAALGCALDDAAVAEVAGAIRVPGRLEVLSTDPVTLVDGAHNPDGVAALAAALPDVLGGREVVGVVSILDDKDANGMLRALLPSLHTLIATASRNPRSLAPATLGSLAGQLGFTGPIELERDPNRALARAQALAGPEGAVVATGSIYLVADLLALPNGRRRASAL